MAGKEDINVWGKEVKTIIRYDECMNIRHYGLGKAIRYLPSLQIQFPVQCVQQAADVNKLFLDCTIQKHFVYICMLLYTLYSGTGAVD